MARILLESSIKLISWTSTTANCFFISLSSSPLFYQDRWMCCVFTLHFPASQPMLSFRGIRFIVWWKCSFLSFVRMGREHLGSNQCLMVSLGHAAELSAQVLWVTRWNWSFTGGSKLSNLHKLIPWCPTWINIENCSKFYRIKHTRE